MLGMSSPDPRPLIIEPYAGDGTDWNRFAVAHPGVRFCHLWQHSKVIQECYGYAPYALVARRGGAIAAVWPASVAKSLLFGRRLVSQPFAEYGGLLADGMDAIELGALVRHVREDAAKAGVTHIEVHGSTGLPEEVRAEYFVTRNPYGCAILKLDPDPDRLLSHVFDKQVRTALQKAARSGLTSYEDHSLETIRRRFWPLFLRSMKRLGSPPHPFSYFAALRKHYAGELKIFWAEAGGHPISALLGFAVGKRIQITTIVSNEECWPLRGNDLVHWEFVKWGCRNGYQEFDFGSVRYEGQLRYKKKWGADIREAGYYLAAIRRDAIPETFDSSSKLMTKAASVWSRWVPVWSTPLLGPPIRKQLIR